MPIYIYSHPETGEEKEVFQKFSEEHVYEESGLKWKRVYTVPNLSIPTITRIDPYSSNDFVNKTSAGKGGTLGDLWDASAELSAKRAEQNNGVDPVKKKLKDDYKAKTGKEHKNPLDYKDKVVTL